MNDFEKYLKKIEKNYEERNLRKKVTFQLKGEEYEVLLPNRSEKSELFYSRKASSLKFGDLFEWLKPTIYKSFQLKELAMKAKEEGYINSYYDIIELLFDAEDVARIVDFMLEQLNTKNILEEEVELQKK